MYGGGVVGGVTHLALHFKASSVAVYCLRTNLQVVRPILKKLDTTKYDAKVVFGFRSTSKKSIGMEARRSEDIRRGNGNRPYATACNL